MPGFDGTGPRGDGPMTGGGRGYCVLRLPRSGDQPVEGLAGAAGRPVHAVPSARQVKAASLRQRAAELEHMIRALGRSVSELPRRAW